LKRYYKRNLEKNIGMAWIGYQLDLVNIIPDDLELIAKSSVFKDNLAIETEKKLYI